MSTRLPVMLSVPVAGGSPGAKVPPALIVTFETVPVPLSVPAFTVTPLDEAILPVTDSVPPLTVVAPV